MEISYIHLERVVLILPEEKSMYLCIWQKYLEFCHMKLWVLSWIDLYSCRLLTPEGSASFFLPLLAQAYKAAGLWSPSLMSLPACHHECHKAPLVASGRLLGGASWLASTALPQASRLQGLKYYLSRQSRSPPLVLELPWVSHVPSESSLCVPHEFQVSFFQHFSKATCD